MHIILYYTATELYKLEREMSKLYCAHFSAECSVCGLTLRKKLQRQNHFLLLLQNSAHKSFDFENARSFHERAHPRTKCYKE